VEDAREVRFSLVEPEYLHDVDDDGGRTVSVRMISPSRHPSRVSVCLSVFMV
jgi:hypothetical protein